VPLEHRFHELQLRFQENDLKIESRRKQGVQKEQGEEKCWRHGNKSPGAGFFVKPAKIND
jgi:hypothetical protein